MQCCEKENRIEALRQKDSKRLLSVQDERFIVRSVVLHPKIPATKIAAELFQRRGESIGSQTVRRILLREVYSGRTSRRKPFISESNRKKTFTIRRNICHLPQKLLEICPFHGRK